MRKVASRVAIAFCTTLVLASGLLLALLHKRELEAEKLLRRVQALEGRNTSDQVHELERSFRSFLRSNLCVTSRCVMVFEIDNTPLPDLHLSRPVRLITSITYEQYRTIEVSVSYSLLVVKEAASNVHVTKLLTEENPKAFEIKRFPLFGKPPSIALTLSSNASKVEQEIGFSLNLKCISMIPGCHGLDDLAPRLATLTKERSPTELSYSGYALRAN